MRLPAVATTAAGTPTAGEQVQATPDKSTLLCRVREKLGAIALQHLDDHLRPALPKLLQKVRHVMPDRVAGKTELLAYLPV